MKKATTIRILDNGELDLNYNLKILAGTSSCQYYGDIQLKSDPTSFKDAVKLLKQLPTLVENDKQSAKPKKILVYPLYLLSDFIQAKKQFHQINNSTLSKCLKSIENLKRLQTSFTNIKSNLSSSKIFYRTEKQISRVCIRLYRIEYDIRRKMMKLLPEIRGYLAHEKAFIDLLTAFDWHSLTEQKINSWIQFKTEEINLFTKFVNDLKSANNIHVLTSSSAEYETNMDAEVSVRLIIHFTENNDRFLSEISQHLGDCNELYRW